MELVPSYFKQEVKMNYIEKLIKRYHVLLEHDLKPLWNKERSRICIYDVDRGKMIGSCSNEEYACLSEKYGLSDDISEDEELLQALFDNDDYVMRRVVKNGG